MRTSEIHRKTRETDIQVRLNLDGSGQVQIETGIGFFNHMLNHLAVHGMLDLDLKAQGDLHIDFHHTIEDCGLVIGQAIDLALGARNGIVRMASSYVPMDEALAFAALDLSGRPYTVFDAHWHTPQVGGIDVSLFEHFFQSMAITGRFNLHAKILAGRDDHHQIEALFKAFARTLDTAKQIDARRQGAIPSTKGSL